MQTEIPQSPPRRLRNRSGAVVNLATLVLISLTTPLYEANAAPTLTTLHTFLGSNGANPEAPLVQGADGAFYGTTNSGGSFNFGTVFKITPGGTFTLLHSMNPTVDGSGPHGDLVLGSDGNYYSTNVGGGPDNLGTVFKITPGGTLTNLYSFSATGMRMPIYGVVEGNDGNFYGSAQFGSSGFGNGSLFKMTPAGVLTNFHVFNSTDGVGPEGDLVLALDGNFYGETNAGGAGGGGTVFKITPLGVFTTLHDFAGSDGMYPKAGLIRGSDGNFYGVTENGGTANLGTVFKITPSGTLTTLYSFSGVDGRNPQGRLIQATDGNFYGTTYVGGSSNAGTIFKITPAGVLTTLYTFTDTTDGRRPRAGLVQGTDGDFYGATHDGGTGDLGTVYKLSGVISAPPSAPSSLAGTAGDAAITLTWSASVGATSYKIFQGATANGESATPVQTGVTATTVTITGLGNGSTYYFKVAAVNASGTSGLSPEVNATPLAVPSQVMNLTVTAGNSQAGLIWLPVAGATTYTVYSGTSSGSEVQLAAGITGTSYNATNLTNGTQYFFKVAGINASGIGPQSSEASATPIAGVTATSTFSPIGGTYASAQTVTLSDSTPGATIHYTLDGTSPTSASPTYTQPISVGSTMTIKAIAVATGYADSAATSATYTINIPQPSQPSQPPAGGGGAFGLQMLIALLVTAIARRSR